VESVEYPLLAFCTKYPDGGQTQTPNNTKHTLNCDSAITSGKQFNDTKIPIVPD